MTDGTSGLDHPDLTPVAAGMRADWRDETEAATEEAAAVWRHGRTLEDWLNERMHAGDRIAVTIGDQRFAGYVHETGDDLVALRAVFGRVDIHLVPGLPLFIELYDHATSGGDRAETRRSFHDALVLRDGRSDLTVGTIHDPEGLDGTLYVGRNFVSVVAKLGAETVVPLNYVTWVSVRRS
jgi:hypothetical protein